MSRNFAPVLAKTMISFYRLVGSFLSRWLAMARAGSTLVAVGTCTGHWQRRGRNVFGLLLQARSLTLRNDSEFTSLADKPCHGVLPVTVVLPR